MIGSASYLFFFCLVVQLFLEHMSGSTQAPSSPPHVSIPGWRLYTERRVLQYPPRASHMLSRSAVTECNVIGLWCAC